MQKSSSSESSAIDVAYIAIGSNLGDRHALLAFARDALAALPRTRLLRVSTVDETAPIGPVPQPDYLNQMVALETELEPSTLLRALQQIEQAAGRVRAERWGPRTLDLDIVYLERQRVDEPSLRVPHPELPNRDFWRRQLAELMEAS